MIGSAISLVVLAAEPVRLVLLPTPTTASEIVVWVTMTSTSTNTPTATTTLSPPTETPLDELLVALATLQAALSATPIPSHTPTEAPPMPPTETTRPIETPTRTPTAAPTNQSVASPTVAPHTAVATATGSSSNPVGGGGSGAGLPMSFENFGLWGRGAEANGSFTRSTEQAHGGAASGKLEYQFNTPENDYVVFLQSNAISGNPNALQLWVYGDGSGHFLNVWIQDAGRQTWQVPFGRVTHTGWQQMTGHIDTNQSWPWTVISGGDDPNVDYPISFRGFVLDDKDDAYTGQGTIYLDDLTATTIDPAPTPSHTPDHSLNFEYANDLLSIDKLGVGNPRVTYPKDMLLDQSARIELVIALSEELASLTSKPNPSEVNNEDMSFTDEEEREIASQVIGQESLLEYETETSGVIGIYPLMAAKLGGIGFDIYPEEPIIQFFDVKELSSLLWTWTVTPRQIGRGSLILTIYIPISQDGQIQIVQSSRTLTEFYFEIDVLRQILEGTSVPTPSPTVIGISATTPSSPAAEPMTLPTFSPVPPLVTGISITPASSSTVTSTVAVGMLQTTLLATPLSSTPEIITAVPTLTNGCDKKLCMENRCRKIGE